MCNPPLKPMCEWEHCRLPALTEVVWTDVGFGEIHRKCCETHAAVYQAELDTRDIDCESKLL